MHSYDGFIMNEQVLVFVFLLIFVMFFFLLLRVAVLYCLVARCMEIADVFCESDWLLMGCSIEMMNNNMLMYTPENGQMSSEQQPFQKEHSPQPSFFKGYVSFRGGVEMKCISVSEVFS